MLINLKLSKSLASRISAECIEKMKFYDALQKIEYISMIFEGCKKLRYFNNSMFNSDKKAHLVKNV